MDFQLAIAAPKVRLINSGARLALCSLWTPPEQVEKTLAGLGIDLTPENSPLALIGGLFGGGLKIMLRNLLYNPQIEHVLVFGKDYSGAGDHLAAFFQGRVHKTGLRQWYRFADGARRELEKVAVNGGESPYFMDELVLPESFSRPPRITRLNFDRKSLDEFFRAYRPGPEPAAWPQRLKIELPEPETEFFPSNKFSQVVTATTILEAWEEVLFRLNRFGEPVSYRNGKQRRELLNLKVVVTRPDDFQPEQLQHFNLPWAEIKAYRQAVLNPSLDTSPGPYSYGNRLRDYFDGDMLKKVSEDLSLAGDSRHNFVTLWDNRCDLPAPHDVPCLTTLFFRKIKGQVHLTAAFRSHNATRAWPRNAFGLLSIMEHVCREANQAAGKTEPDDLRPGALTVLSLSISVDPQDLDQVRHYIDDYENRRPRLELDPNGYLRLAVDREAGEIIVQHYNHQNELLDEYRGRTPGELARRLERLAVVSDLGHALYLGSQLERACYCLNNNLEYVQDKKILKLDGP